MQQPLKQFIGRIIFSALLLVSIGFLFYPPSGLTAEQVNTLVVGIIAIGLWATGIIPEHITALLFFAVSMLFSIAEPELVFSGFSSSAFWLVFGGLIIGIAIQNTGLGKRLAILIVARLQAEYVRLISGIVLIGMILSFLMPSAMARMVLFIPIVLLIASHFGFQPGSNGRIGLVLAAITSTFFPAFSILPANVANMVLTGLYESQLNGSILYGNYLLVHFPIFGALKAILIIFLTVKFYPDTVKTTAQTELEQNKYWSKNELILAVILFLALLFWMTDFIHHISPAWIAIVAAIILLFPGIGIVNQKEFNSQINYASLFFVAGIIGFGVVIARSGLGQVMVENLLLSFPLDPEAHFINYIVLSLMGILTALATTSPGVPAVLMPLAEPLAQASGLPLKSVVMTQVIGYSTTIFPYQTAPVLIAMNLAGEKLAHGVKFCALLALLSILLLLPVNYLWWQYIGIL